MWRRLGGGTPTRVSGLPRVSIVVPFLVNQFYGWDPIIEILVNQKKELQWRL